jgi:hypothetical protein
LETELEDVRAALDGALARRDFVAGAELQAAVGDAWAWAWNQWIVREGLARGEALLSALGDADVHLLGDLASIVAVQAAEALLFITKALETAALAVDAARSAGDSETIVATLSVI